MLWLQELAHFWYNTQMTAAVDEERMNACAVEPLRILQPTPNTACLAVHPWWLLLIAATAGTVPSNALCGTLAAHWTQRFFELCVPPHMCCGKVPSSFSLLL